MSAAYLLEAMRGYLPALLGWIAAHDAGVLALWGLVVVALTAGALIRLRRRRAIRARAAWLAWGIHDLKEQLRTRLAEPRAPFANGAVAAPTLGATAAFEADLEAAAKSVLLDADGRRAKAKHMLRARLSDGNGKLNGSEADCWRQLGALSLIDSTQDAMRAYARAAELSPDDGQAQMLSGLLHLRAGKLEHAEAAFRRQLALCNGDGAMSVRHRAGTMLGDVLIAKGEPEGALAAYEEARRDAEALAEREAEKPDWQRDLSITHDRIADVLLAKGQLDLALESCRRSLAIAEALVARDPGNAGWQRDLSVAHERLGDALERHGDLDGALVSFRAGLAIAEALVRREPERREWQWDLSVSLDRLGDVLHAKGKVGEAMAAYRRGLEMAETLAAIEPGRTAWQRDLAVSFHKVGQLEALGGNDSEARELLERGRGIIARLDRIAAYQAQWRADLSKFDEALSRLGA